jgi:hypothetical protein
MPDDAADNVLALIREGSIELKGFKQHGEAEPGGASFVAEQFARVLDSVQYWASSSPCQSCFIGHRV